MTDKPAEDAYASAYGTAIGMITRLQDMIGDMPAPGGDCDITWANIGDLAHVCELLQRVIDFTEDVLR